MKKVIVGIVVACLSLFVVPEQLNASSLAGPKENTELPVIPPGMEKKINEFRKNHPDMFTKKDNRDADADQTAAEAKRAGLIGFVFTVGITVVIVLLILMFI
jgi:hypothetical protein